MKCPVCNTALKNTYRDHIEYTLCESGDICPNGHYGEYYAYGYWDMSFEDGKQFGLSYHDSSAHSEEVYERVKEHGRKLKWKINPVLRKIRRARDWLGKLFTTRR